GEGGLEVVAATAIEFKPASPEVVEPPAEEDAPEAPMLFLEPKQAEVEDVEEADEERPPAG
ncbi:hypothetical protein, partial [Actinomadura rubrisoli]|uniref:hypothetical protein n=1 Tax=Actinomadura rubrisoli TaxID=2530368 RepID=UPI001A9F953E